MSKDNRIKSILSQKVNMTPSGFVADDLSPMQFTECHEIFFDHIFHIQSSDITGIEGYGEFNDDCETEYVTCSDYLLETFANDKEGYWYNWREMFETTVLDQSFFESYFDEMKSRIPYCEGKRYLFNNNTFFVNMITDGKTRVGFPDWSRSGIGDFLLDFAIMDLNKPYLKIPELLVQYCDRKGIHIPNFTERFLCMAYYKGIDTLRWHASIEDIQSCKTIMASISQLKERLYAL